MGFLEKLKIFILGEPKSEELLKYEAELKADFAKEAMKAKYANKLKEIKSGKKSGIAELGASIMKASDKVNTHDFMAGSGQSMNTKKKNDFGLLN